MKIFLRVTCVYIVLGLVAILYTIFSNDIDYLLQGFGATNIMFKIASFFIKTVPYLLTIMFCAIRIQKKEERFFVRLVPFYLIIGVILSALVTFIDLENASESFYNFAVGAHSFIQFTNYGLLPVCILENLNPNNIISRTFKIGGYIAVAASFISIIILYIKIFMVSKLPNVYGYDGFNFATVASTETFVTMVVAVSIIVCVFFIILGFISNCAFESETIESDSLSYDELLAQADKIAEQRRKEIYDVKEKEVQIDRSVSETTGMMNINNQLTAGSNVGEVKGVGLGASLVEGALPSSSGPVMNNSVREAPKDDNSNQPVVQVTAPPTTPTQVAASVTPATPVQVDKQPTEVSNAKLADPSSDPEILS